MTDIPAGPETTASVVVGGTFEGEIEVGYDQDWIRIELVAGQQVVIDLEGVGDEPLSDPYLRLRDSTGTQVAANDDGGWILDSRLVFTPTVSGTYYIDVGASFDPLTGTYRVTVVEPPTVTSSGTQDSVWGFNNTADTQDYDPVESGRDFVTISDGGGNDTLDFSGFDSFQWIDLRPGAMSEVGGVWRNLQISSTTLIENAIGGSGNDSIYGNSADNHLYGGASYDDLYGGAGNDVLDGGSGDDWMAGGVGDDTYLVDSRSDIAAEYLGQGSGDTIYSSIDFMIAYEIERLILTGSAVTATGNGVANILIGNAGANLLDGRGGDDILDGGAGADLLDGGTGNDRLDGGAGADLMRGGLGDDSFYVDSSDDRVVERRGEGTDTIYSAVNYTLRGHVENLTLIGTAYRGNGSSLGDTITGNDSSNLIDGRAGADTMRGGDGDDRYYVDNSGDRTIENAGQGTDTVYSSISYALSANVENLNLMGTAVRAYGNSLENRLVGNDGRNLLFGGQGADIMRGGLGDDRYHVENAGDRVIEDAGAGRDRVYSNVSFTLGSDVEDLFLRGTGAIDGTGNALDNMVIGNGAANILHGRGGADDLRGGGGADIFRFDNGDFGGLTRSTCDRIVDFNQTQGDIINLRRVDADSGLAGNQPFAFIGTAAFSGGAGQLRYEQADGNTYVYGDTNGDGAADFMIRLEGLHSLVSGDFVL